jgi:hypothetical protein
MTIFIDGFSGALNRSAGSFIFDVSLRYLTPPRRAFQQADDFEIDLPPDRAAAGERGARKNAG